MIPQCRTCRYARLYENHKFLKKNGYYCIYKLSLNDRRCHYTEYIGEDLSVTPKWCDWLKEEEGVFFEPNEIGI